MKIEIIKKKNNFKIPHRAHYNDAGLDVYTTRVIKIPKHTTIKHGLGFGIKLPDGFMGCVFPRTSITNEGLISHICPIDSGYTGEIHCILTNTTNNDILIKNDVKIAQLVIIPIVLPELVDSLGKERAEGNFGSTNEVV